MSIETIKSHIASGSLEKAIEELLSLTQGTDLHNSIVLQSARLNNIKKEERMGIIAGADAQRTRAQITYAILDYLSEVSTPEFTPASTSNVVVTNGKPTVFISYNHKDKSIADNVKTKLEAADIQVTIDSEAMHAGEDIKTFIEKCSRENDITLSLVSTNSLLSAWVAMESALAFAGEKVASKKFIPCAINNEFFGRSFTDDALDKIDEEITEIKDIITRRIANNRGIEDFQNELSRYTQLKQNLPEIVRRLKESLTTDISGDNFEPGMTKVIAAIKKN